VAQFADLKKVLHQDLAETISVVSKVKVQHQKLKTVPITPLQSERKQPKRKMESVGERHHHALLHLLAAVVRNLRVKLFLVVTQFWKRYAKMFLQQS
jgi:ribosome-binding factor A